MYKHIWPFLHVILARCILTIVMWHWGLNPEPWWTFCGQAEAPVLHFLFLLNFLLVLGVFQGRHWSMCFLPCTDGSRFISHICVMYSLNISLTIMLTTFCNFLVYLSCVCFSSSCTSFLINIYFYWLYMIVI